MRTIVPGGNGSAAGSTNAEERRQCLLSTRERCLKLGADLPWEERGAILELLGSVERAFFLMCWVRPESRGPGRIYPLPRVITVPHPLRLFAVYPLVLGNDLSAKQEDNSAHLKAYQDDNGCCKRAIDHIDQGELREIPNQQMAGDLP
jgi:hypothetical protein